MSKFEDHFNEPARDISGSTGWAIRGDISKEAAAAAFAEAAPGSYDYKLGEEPSAAAFMESIKPGFARFHGDYDDDGEWRLTWWWQYGEPQRPGDKIVWLAH